jgi:uncharacterized membrane protein
MHPYVHNAVSWNSRPAAIIVLRARWPHQLQLNSTEETCFFHQALLWRPVFAVYRIETCLDFYRTWNEANIISLGTISGYHGGKENQISLNSFNRYLSKGQMYGHTNKMAPKPILLGINTLRYMILRRIREKENRLMENRGSVCLSCKSKLYVASEMGKILEKFYFIYRDIRNL